MGANRTGSKTGADDHAKRNRESVVRVSLMVAIALVLASSAPPNLVLTIFSGLLFIGAAVAAIFAVLMRDDPFAGNFTRWDETAALLGLGMAAGLFIDPAIDGQTIETAAAVADLGQ